MRKLVAFLVVALIALVSITYYYFSGKEYIVSLSEAEIQSKLDDKLPITKTHLFIIQITLDNPRVYLENGSDRVRAGLDVILNISLNENRNPLGGGLDLSGGIKYLAEKGQFFLTDPIIENLEVQGIPNNYTDRINTALSKILAEFYETHPIYTLDITDVKQATARLILKNVIVKNKKLVITLGI